MLYCLFHDQGKLDLEDVIKEPRWHTLVGQVSPFVCTCNNLDGSNSVGESVRG